MKKYLHTFMLLNAAGWGMVVISRYIFPKAQGWISGIGYLLVAAGLVVTLVGIVTERRELEAKRQADTK